MSEPTRRGHLSTRGWNLLILNNQAQGNDVPYFHLYFEHLSMF